MVASRQGPTRAVSTRSMADGTMCRQLAPLPGPIAERMDTLRAARGGTPYNVSPRHTVRPALQFRLAQIRQALATARSREDVLCIAAQWLVIKSEYEMVLQERLAYDREAPGDEAVTNTVLTVLSPVPEMAETFTEIAKSVFADEPALSDGKVGEAVWGDLWSWARDTLLEMAGEKRTKKQLKPLAQVLRSALRKVGVSIGHADAVRIARRLSDAILKSARVVLRAVAVWGAPPVVMARILLTPSSTASRRFDEDSNPHYAGEIERAISEALNRVDHLELQQILTLEQTGPELRTR